MMHSIVSQKISHSLMCVYAAITAFVVKHVEISHSLYIYVC